MASSTRGVAIARALALWAALAAAAALAAPDDGGDAVAESTAAMTLGEFERALAILDRAAPRAEGSARAKLHVLRAECFEALGRAGPAEEAMVAALSADPEARLEPARASPTLVALLDRARQKVLGELAVRVSEPAEVFVEGKPFGPAPVMVRLPVGRYRVSARAEARTAEEVVLVRADQRRTLELALPPPIREPAVDARATSSRRGWAIVPAIGGVGLAAAGSYFLVRSADISDRLAGRGRYATEVIPRSEADALAQQGEREQTAGVVLVGVGAAALLGAAGLAFWPEGPRVAAASSGEAFGLSLAGVWP